MEVVKNVNALLIYIYIFMDSFFDFDAWGADSSFKDMY